MPRRRSAVTCTPVTVTKPIRGSFSFWMASARTSRNSSATRAVLAPCVTLVRPLVPQSSGECNVGSVSMMSTSAHRSTKRSTPCITFFR